MPPRVPDPVCNRAIIQRKGFRGQNTNMATLIPALGTCTSRMTAGERRLAERLEQKLDEDKDDDGIPLLKPISCGRDIEAPLTIRLPTLRDEAARIADLLNAAHKECHAWGDMAVVALPGVGQMPAPGDDEQAVAGRFSVGATPRRVISACGDGGFGGRLDSLRTTPCR